MTSKAAVCFLCVLACVAILMAQGNKQVIIGQFVVRLRPEDTPRADEIAASYGLLNLGNVGEMPHVFLFNRPNATRGLEAITADVETVKSIASDEAVAWIEQDEYHRKRAAALPSDPQFVNGNDWHLDNRISEGNDINVKGVWTSGITGNGVVVMIMDDGLWKDNQDISPNFLLDYSWNFETGDQNPTPSTTRDYHGTFCGGIIAAKNDNGFCGVGVAYNAKLSGVRFLGVDNVPTSSIASYMTKFSDQVHIINNSWGNDACISETRVCDLGDESQSMMESFENGAQNGRNGKGKIYVSAAGNEGDVGGDPNYDKSKTSRFVINVSALDVDGTITGYSNQGAGVHVSAPGGGSKKAISSLNANSCSSGQGTSYSCPVISGVVALMLEKNPNLTWRDVKYILAITASKTDPSSSSWAKNAAGYNVSPAYGFGRVDAGAAVAMAALWTQVGAEVAIPVISKDVKATIPDADSTGVSSTATVSQSIFVEHVQVTVDITHPKRGQLSIQLISPSGTSSYLALARNDPNADYNNWPLLTLRCWGETSAGDWKLRVVDSVSGVEGTLNSWSLQVFGVAQKPSVPSTPAVATPTPVQSVDPVSGAHSAAYLLALVVVVLAVLI